MKSSSADTKASTKLSELNKVAVKTASIETNVFTYYSDGSLYQYQNIKEQADQAEFRKLKTEEKQMDKQEQTVKETKPAKLLLFICIAGVFFFLLLARKFSV